MIQMLGNNRVFDSLILETNTSSSNARVIDLYGVQSMSELEDKLFIVKSSLAGNSGNATMDITTDSGSTTIGSSIPIYIDGSDTLVTDWVKVGQPYFLIYDNTQQRFNVYPV